MNVPTFIPTFFVDYVLGLSSPLEKSTFSFEHFFLHFLFFPSLSSDFPLFKNQFYIKIKMVRGVSARVGGMMITQTKKLLVNLFSYGSGLLGVIKGHIVLLLRCTFGGQSQHLGVLKMELVIWSKPGA